MVGYFSNFVKYGNPNGDSLPNWKKWESEGDSLLELGEVIQEIPEKYVSAYKIIEDWNERVNEKES